MPETWIDIDRTRRELASFFGQSHDEVVRFGSTVNQTFEAFVFAATLHWYRDRKWTVTVIHPNGETSGMVVLKFSTRGRPASYSYGRCSLNGEEVHVRHQLRVATAWHRLENRNPANVCLDVAVTKPLDLSHFTTDSALPNSDLISFGEAKHMSAFAELIASFVGLVHELQPARLRNVRTPPQAVAPVHPSPFLYVSGVLYRTAEGIRETVEQRGYDIDIYTETKHLSTSFQLSKIAAPKKTRASLSAAVVKPPRRSHSRKIPARKGVANDRR